LENQTGVISEKIQNIDSYNSLEKFGAPLNSMNNDYTIRNWLQLLNVIFLGMFVIKYSSYIQKNDLQ
jgi:hypothetical protein